MKKYQAIIYDIDGTLINTIDMNMYPLIRIIEEELHIRYKFEDVIKFYPLPGKQVMEILGIKDKKAVYERWVRYVNEYPQKAFSYPGIKEVLEYFAEKGIIQAVVSAKTKEQYAIDMLANDLDKYMKIKVLAEDVQKPKPDPEPLLKCLTALKVPCDEVLYVGDAYSDYLAASRAKIDFGYARWAKIPVQEMIEPTFIFDDPKDMMVLL